LGSGAFLSGVDVAAPAKEHVVGLLGLLDDEVLGFGFTGGLEFSFVVFEIVLFLFLLLFLLFLVLEFKFFVLYNFFIGELHDGIVGGFGLGKALLFKFGLLNLIFFSGKELDFVLNKFILMAVVLDLIGFIFDRSNIVLDIMQVLFKF
jgi:hypothetical protein